MASLLFRALFRRVLAGFTTTRTRVIAGLLSVVAVGGLMSSVPVSAQAADLVVVSPSAIASGWTVYNSSWASVPVTSGVGVVTTPFNETGGAVRLGPAAALSGYKTFEVEFGAGMAGKTIGLNAFGPTNSTVIAGYGPQTVVGADNKAVLALPTEAFSLLYLFGVGTANVTLRNVTLKSAPPATTTTTGTTIASGTTTVAGVTTTVAGTPGTLTVLNQTTGMAPGWKIILGDFNASTPFVSGTGVTVTPLAETLGSLRIWSTPAQSTYRSAQFSFASGRNGTLMKAWAYNAGTQVAGYEPTATISNNAATLALPTTAYDVLYLWNLGTSPITFTSIVQSTSVPSVTTTTVAGSPTTLAGGSTSTTVAGAGGDLAALTPSAWASGWSLTPDFSGTAVVPAPTGSGVTVTPAAETNGTVRIVSNSLQTIYRSVEVEFGAGMEGKDVGVWAFNSAGQILSYSQTARVTSNRLVFPAPASFTVILLYGLGAAPVTFRSITLRTTTSTPTTTIASGVTTTTIPTASGDVVALSPSAWAPGWRLETDFAVKAPAPSGSGVTVTPATDTQGTVRIVSDNLQSAFKTVDIEFGPGMDGKLVGAWAFNSAGQIASYNQTATVTGNHLVFPAPASFTVLTLYYLGTAPVNFRSITFRSSVVAPPTTTPGGTPAASDLVALSPTALSAGWSMNTAWQPGGIPLVSGAGITLTPNPDTGGSARLVAPSAQSGFKSLNVEFGSGMDGKAVSIWVYDSTNTQIANFSSASTVASNTATFTLPTQPFNFIYFFGLGTAPVTFRTATFKNTTSTPPTTTPGGGVSQVDDPNIPAWPTDKTCDAVRVWALGDSLTNGESSLNHLNSFNYELLRLLRADGLPVVFRGTRNFGPVPADDPGFSHSGYGGWNIPHLLNGNPGATGDGSVSTWAPIANPDVIVLNIGTNTGDANDGTTLRTLVARLQQLSPNAVIVIGTLPLTLSNLTIAYDDPRRRSITQAALDLGNASSTDNILVADIETAMRSGIAGVSSPVVAADFASANSAEVHFSVSGGVKFAQALRLRTNQAVRKIGCRNGVINPNATTTTSVPGGTAGTNLSVVNAAGTVVYGPGFSSTPILTSSSAPAALTFTGAAAAGVRALRFESTSSAPIRVVVTDANSPTTYADLTVSSGTTVHSVPFFSELTSAITLRISLTSTSSYTLRSLTLVRQSFQTVTTTAGLLSANTPVAITINGVWDPGVAGRTFLRLQAAFASTACANCGQEIPVTTAGTYSFSAPPPGDYKAVLFTNAPGEVIGISSNFKVDEPPAVCNRRIHPCLH